VRTVLRLLIALVGIGSVLKGENGDLPDHARLELQRLGSGGIKVQYKHR